MGQRCIFSFKVKPLFDISVITALITSSLGY